MREAPVQQRVGGNGFGAVQSYKDLVVWRSAMELSESIHRITREFPREEIHGMGAELRRISIRIPAGIAEGWNRHDKGDYIRSIRAAQGCALELETGLLLSIRLSYAPDQALLAIVEQLAEVQDLLAAMVTALQQKRR